VAYCKPVRDLIDVLTSMGWENIGRRPGRPYPRLKYRNRVISLPATPRDRRALANALASAKRTMRDEDRIASAAARGG